MLPTLYRAVFHEHVLFTTSSACSPRLADAHHVCHRWLGVEVAVKELHATNSVQSNAEMFGEAETLNSLRHPCIIAFYGVVVNQVPMHHLLYSLQIMPTRL